jgi:hypothetical protein
VRFSWSGAKMGAKPLRHTDLSLDRRMADAKAHGTLVKCYTVAPGREKTRESLGIPHAGAVKGSAHRRVPCAVFCHFATGKPPAILRRQPPLPGVLRMSDHEALGDAQLRAAPSGRTGPARNRGCECSRRGWRQNRNRALDAAADRRRACYPKA